MSSSNCSRNSSFYFCNYFSRHLFSFTLLLFLFHLIIIYSWGVYHPSVSWWSFTEVWGTASLLKSSGHFSVFWPITIMWFITPVLADGLSLKFEGQLVSSSLQDSSQYSWPITIMWFITPVLADGLSLKFEGQLVSSSLQDSSQYSWPITIMWFITPVLADGLSLKFEGQQVSSSLQDSSQYSGRSQ